MRNFPYRWPEHRVAGIREAVKQNPSIADDAMSVIFVAYKGLIPTRQLFTTLNWYAVPVNQGERIILDDDDAFAIVTRLLLERTASFLVSG